MHNQAQWLEERRKGIGSSDIAAILGLSPFKTAYRVYQEKRREVEDWEGSTATDWGKRMEPVLRQWYSDVSGRAVRLPEKILYHSRYPFLLDNPDGLTDDQRVVEIKTARSAKGWGEPGTDEIPDYYAVQCHHHMIVTGFDVCDVPVSIAGAPPELYEIPADKELAELIIDAAAEFWQMVIDGNPPEPVTYADAVQRYGTATGTASIIAAPDVEDRIEELRATRNQIASLEALEADLKGKLIGVMRDDCDCIVDHAGTVLCTYRLSKGRKAFDAKALEKEDPETYRKYLRTGEPSRRFLLK